MEEQPKDNTGEKAPTHVDETLLSDLFLKPINLFILQKLREGPIERGAFHKLLNVKFRNLEGKPRSYIEKLIDLQFIREYDYEKTKPNPDRTPNQYPNMEVGQKQTFYLLVKDFYAIRKPAIDTLEKLPEMGFPDKEIQSFRKDIEVYFKKYTSQKLTGDDPEVIGLFQDQKMVAAISLLSQHVYQLNDFTTEFQQKHGSDPSKILKDLESHDFVKIIPIPTKNQTWVVLKTAIELKTIFPDYLIRAINQLAAEKKLDKDYAIRTLNFLKKSYLELEKPELIKTAMKKIQEYQAKMGPINAKVDQWKKDNKSTEKLTKDEMKLADKMWGQIIEQYNQIGDVQAIEQSNKAWETLKQYYPETKTK